MSRRPINCTRCWLLILSAVTLVSVGCFILTVFALRQSTWPYGIQIYNKSQQLHTTPDNHNIETSGGTLELTLPNDLRDYIGHVYRIGALDNGGHTIRIESGTFGTDWDNAGHLLATFSGAASDFLQFYVKSRNDIVVLNSPGVSFT